MEIVVVFRYPDITDPDSEEATLAIEQVTEAVESAGVDCDSWHIEEVLGDAIDMEGE